MVVTDIHIVCFHVNCMRDTFLKEAKFSLLLLHFIVGDSGSEASGVDVYLLM